MPPPPRETRFDARPLAARAYTLFELAVVLAFLGATVTGAAYFASTMRTHLEWERFTGAADAIATELRDAALNHYTSTRCGASVTTPQRGERASYDDGRPHPHPHEFHYRFRMGGGVPRLRIGFFIDGYSHAQHVELAARSRFQMDTNPNHGFSPSPQLLFLPEEIILPPLETHFGDRSRRTLRAALGDPEDC